MAKKRHSRGWMISSLWIIPDICSWNRSCTFIAASQSSLRSQLAMLCLTSSIHKAKGATACSCHDA